MDYDRLFVIADLARRRGRLSDSDITFVRDDIPNALADYKRPAAIDHPGGFKVTGAPAGTFTRCALVLAGQKALGRRAGGHGFYERVESGLALSITAAYFEGMAPKGAFCCSTCTLAILPVLEAGAIRYFDCKPLAREVRTLIQEKRWRFAGKQNPKILKWSLEGPPV